MKDRPAVVGKDDILRGLQEAVTFLAASGGSRPDSGFGDVVTRSDTFTPVPQYITEEDDAGVSGTPAVNQDADEEQDQGQHTYYNQQAR